MFGEFEGLSSGHGEGGSGPNIFWVSEDQGKAKEETKMRTEEEGRQYQRVDRDGICQLGQLKIGLRLFCPDNLAM